MCGGGGFTSQKNTPNFMVHSHFSFNQSREYVIPCIDSPHSPLSILFLSANHLSPYCGRWNPVFTLFSMPASNAYVNTITHGKSRKDI